MDENNALKVGQLAERTGLTVRTLHHYDEIGLLTPSERTASGHRLYGTEDVVRLQQILSLRQIGFSLDEVRASLDHPDFSLLRVVELHAAQLRQHIEEERRLCERLEALALRLRAAEEVSTQTLLRTIEVTAMLEEFYTPEQLQELKTRRQALGVEGMEKAQAEWATLMSQVREAMEEGADVNSKEVQALAERWQSLVTAFTGGNPGIEASLRRVYSEAPEAAEEMGGPDLAMRQFIGRVIAAAPKP